MLHERSSDIVPFVEPHVHYFQWKPLVWFISPRSKDQLIFIRKYLHRPCANQIYESAKILLSWIIDLSVNYDWNKKLPLKEKASTKKHAFHWKEWFSLKEITFLKKSLPLKGSAFWKTNGFNWKRWLRLKGMVSTKINDFPKSSTYLCL